MQSRIGIKINEVYEKQCLVRKYIIGCRVCRNLNKESIWKFLTFSTFIFMCVSMKKKNITADTKINKLIDLMSKAVMKMVMKGLAVKEELRPQIKPMTGKLYYYIRKKLHASSFM